MRGRPGPPLDEVALRFARRAPSVFTARGKAPLRSQLRSQLMRGLVIGIIALLPNLAAAQTTLVWKFKAGDVFLYETTLKSDEATITKGQTLKQEVVSTWVYRFDVKAVGSDTATLRIQIEQVTVNNIAGATKNENKLL